MTVYTSSRLAQVSSASSQVQSTEVSASTRSPGLNTGPWPARISRTVRDTMRPSSAIQRCRQPSTPQAAGTIASGSCLRTTDQAR